MQGAKLVGILTERDLVKAMSFLMPEPPVDVEGFLW
jgi:CBS domain-containing protein